MANTPNYNLKKVEYTEIADIPGHFNANFDKIDEELKERDTRVGPLASLLTTIKTSIVNAINSLKGEVDAHKAETAIDNFKLNKFLEMPEDYLELPSVLGNSLATHPSVIDFGEGQSWNGYRYWMAYTPYPGTQNENPSVAASNDNKTWILPTGAPNPLVPAPLAPAYNSDTELVYLNDVNKLRLYYRVVGDGTGLTKLYFIESSDGSNWTTPSLSLETTYQLLSPSIIRESPTLWKMWTVESSTDIHYRTSSDGISWSEPTIIPQPWENWSAWHIGVTKDSLGKYHMLGSTWPDEGSGEGTQYRPIVYASSNDGLTWIPNEKPQLIPTGWGGGYLYRPSFIIDETKGLQDGLPYVRVWFSASDDATAAGWHIGYTEGYLMPGDKNPSATSKKIKRKKLGEYFKVFASNIVASFAKISRIKTKRIEVTSDFSQPLVEFRDGRIGRNGGNYLRHEYFGESDPNLIRYRMLFTDDEGNQSVIIFAPFTGTMSFSTPTELVGLKQVKVEEIINYDGFRSYKDENKFNRIVTDSSGNLQIQLTATEGVSKTWKFRSVDGCIDAENNGIFNQSFLALSKQTSRPGHLSSSVPGIYLADGVTHDPVNTGSGKPYLVYWDGASYTKLS